MNRPAQNADNRARPGLLVLLASIVAVACISLWINKSKPASPQAVDVATATVDDSSPAEPSVDVTPAATVEPLASGPPSAVEEKWGIQVAGVLLSRSGSAVEVRYRVTDPEKVARLAGANGGLAVIDQASGVKLEMISSPQAQTSAVPANVNARATKRMARLAGEFPPPGGRITPGGAYSVLVPNANGSIKSGSKVAVVVGDTQVAGLAVP